MLLSTILQYWPLLPVLFWALVLLLTILSSKVYLDIENLEEKNLNEWPCVSIMAPAKDEEENVESALRSLCAINYPNLQVIAVNDRSTDKTGAIMDQLQQQLPQLLVIHIKELPDLWLGKNHANYTATNQATGEFLLFTDGDVVHDPEALKKIIPYMLENKIDCVAGIPFITKSGYCGRGFYGLFTTLGMLYTRPWRFLGKTQKHYGDLGIGAFNLVRADLYRKAGGHQPLRMEVADDMKLGRLLSRCGANQELVILGKKTHLAWHNGFRGLIKGLEKNAFAVAEYSLFKALFILCVIISLGISPFIPLFMGLNLSAAGGVLLCFLFLMGIYGTTASSGSVSYIDGLFLPMGCLIATCTVANSTYKTLRNGGISWRDTFYPLPLLKEKCYR